VFALYETQRIQGGEDPKDALSLQVIFRKRALLLLAFLREMTCDLRHPMSLRHPVVNSAGLFLENVCPPRVAIDFLSQMRRVMTHTATQCKILQRTATHCNALQHIATHCNTLRHIFFPQLHVATGSLSRLRRVLNGTLQHSATHCNTHSNTFFFSSHLRRWAHCHD